jgi:hypothetical protein
MAPLPYEEFPKIPRLFQGDIVITEKIDGTNGGILISKAEDDDLWVPRFTPTDVLPRPLLDGDSVAQFEDDEGTWWNVRAQSRSRLVTPAVDNHGFAKWVRGNAESLVKDLGPGRHFGEWYGQGIQRRYGLDHKRFALFNTARWPQNHEFKTQNLTVVPELFRGPFSEVSVHQALSDLAEFGSLAGIVPFGDPEGIMIYHERARHYFKVTYLDKSKTGIY